MARRRKTRSGSTLSLTDAARALSAKHGMPPQVAFEMLKARRSTIAAARAATGDAIGLSFKLPRDADFKDGTRVIVNIEEHVLGQILNYGGGGSGAQRALGIFQSRLERDGYWFDMRDGETMIIRTTGSESMAIRRMDLRSRRRGVSGCVPC